jgi:hypothetical protein
MRFVTPLLVVPALCFAAPLSAPRNALGQTAQACQANLTTCEQVKACAPFKDKSSPNYTKWINCIAFDNPSGQPSTLQQSHRGGLPFQSPLVAPAR